MLHPEYADSATVLLNEFVDADLSAALKLIKDEDKHEEFASEIRMFRLATLIMALGVAGEKYPKSKALLSNIEYIVFPNEDESGYQMLAELKFKMKEISDIVSDVKNVQKNVLWCREWLEGLCIEESNPIDLLMIVGVLVNGYIAAANIVRDFNMEAI